jgi:hypothetical protein
MKPPEHKSPYYRVTTAIALTRIVVLTDARDDGNSRDEHCSQTPGLVERRSVAPHDLCGELN